MTDPSMRLLPALLALTGCVPPVSSEADSGGEDATEPPEEVSPLYDETTTLDPALQELTDEALITRFGDRARDRHAREDEFQAYDHYLAFYWEHRTAAVEIVDRVAAGGSDITFYVETRWRLSPDQAELRAFYRGTNTVAEYHDNAAMTPLGDLQYTRTVNWNPVTNAPLAVGDRMEFELSQFLEAPPRGRSNYYGTTYLYIVGQGLVPWEARGTFGDPSTEREDSYPIPEAARLGGRTTLSRQYSDEADNRYLQMATNLSDIHAQEFVLGRRVHHTDLTDGSHNESDENPLFHELAGLAGRAHINPSCVGCHERNGRALPPAAGQPADRYVVKIGRADGAPDPTRGAVLQPQGASGEGHVVLDGWDEADGLRTPRFSFDAVPEAYSARIAPALVGLGLLEAIPESAIEALEDPDDSDGDGISGRAHRVLDPGTGVTRLGRFGWKAGRVSVRRQVAAALNTDLGVPTSLLPELDCGPNQPDCAPPGAQLNDLHLDRLTAYVSLLGVPPRRGLESSAAQQGEVLFADIGCTGCHVEAFRTTSFHPRAELRDQSILPYTDLLLHDMGPGLAATLPEGDADGSEWRTPPLWGIGLSAGVSGGEAYLHDGRARTLAEAVRWHGGEAEASKIGFEALTDDAQADLISFLGTL